MLMNGKMFNFNFQLGEFIQFNLYVCNGTKSSLRTASIIHPLNVNKIKDS